MPPTTNVLSVLLLLWSSAAFSSPALLVQERRLPPTCDSKIYCQGELLHVIQTAELFPDSKTFVDMRIRGTVDQTLIDFEQLMAATGREPSRDQIADFVSTHFDSENVLEEWNPPDFNPNPAFLDAVTDAGVRNFAQVLVGLWPSLGRHVKPDVFENPDHYSVIPVPNGFVVPGGRFQEFYYWDTYWIIKGLLISGMNQTTRYMIENLMSMVDEFGFVPNGGRVYYTRRSQPPLLAHMVWEYVQATKDFEWLSRNVDRLENELRFWLRERTVVFSHEHITYRLALYRSETLGPRPESYVEDLRTAAFFPDEAKRQEVYNDLKSAAESGWDFSSRWVFDELGGTAANISHIATRRVLPVDLNAFLYGAFHYAAELYDTLGNAEKRDYWRDRAQYWKEAIRHVMWDEEDGTWYDFDLESSARRKMFSLSNLAPLWTAAYDEGAGEEMGRRASAYLEANRIADYLGGVPTTLDHTSEQWDFPNAWPPLQAIVVQGLARTGSAEAAALAKTFAENWVNANFAGYNATGNMYEKYHAEIPGQRGEGGEYVVQTGFGWTNGVVLEFIKEYLSGDADVAKVEPDSV